MESVVVLPRKIFYEQEKTPDNLDYRVYSAKNKLAYALACLHTIFEFRRFDLIICTHINLLPVAWLLKLFHRCPVIPVIYGYDSWAPTSRKFVNFLCHRLESFISIRHLTASLFIKWTKISSEKYYYLPNCIDESKFGVRDPRKDLIERYKIKDKTVVMTTARLDSGVDLNKGVDEILEVLPELKNKIPNLVYLIIGDGEDRSRLEAKAKDLGVTEMTVFTGYIPESEKADYYCLADVFAMPGSNPDFDRYPYRFAFLEALACGIPVVGCRLEDTWEVNDPESKLIIQIDPKSKDEIMEGILTALSCPKRAIQPGLKRFYFDNFKENFHGILKDVFLKAKRNYISK
jgi:phosphatidylinositol alpha-1,6-mannosyltransferase